MGILGALRDSNPDGVIGIDEVAAAVRRSECFVDTGYTRYGSVFDRSRCLAILVLLFKEHESVYNEFRTAVRETVLTLEHFSFQQFLRFEPCVQARVIVCLEMYEGNRSVREIGPAGNTLKPFSEVGYHFYAAAQTFVREMVDVGNGNITMVDMMNKNKFKFGFAMMRSWEFYDCGFPGTNFDKELRKICRDFRKELVTSL